MTGKKRKSVYVHTFYLVAFALFEAVRALQSGGGAPYMGAPLHTTSQQHLASQQHHPSYQQQEAEYRRVHQQSAAPIPATPEKPDTGAAAAAADEPPPLPRGWGELRTGDGRPYYVFYPTGAVQWQRPAPEPGAVGDDAEGGQREVHMGAGGEMQGARADGGGGGNGDGDRGGEESPQAGESEMSDAERDMDTRGSEGIGARTTGGGGAAHPPGNDAGAAAGGQMLEQPQVNNAGRDSYPSAPWNQKAPSAAETPDSSSPRSHQQQPQAGTSLDARWSTTPSANPPFEPTSQQQQHQRPAPDSPEFQQWGSAAVAGGGGGGGDAGGSNVASTPAPREPLQQSQGREVEPSTATGDRPPSWGVDVGRQAPSEQPPRQPPADSGTQPPPIWGVSHGQEQVSGAGDGDSPAAPGSQPWGTSQSAVDNRDQGESAGRRAHPAGESWNTAAAAPRGQVLEQGHDEGDGGGPSRSVADPWSGGGSHQVQIQGRLNQEQQVGSGASAASRAGAYAGAVERTAPMGEAGLAGWGEHEQVRPTPHPASYPQQQQPPPHQHQAQESPQGFYDRAPPIQQQQQQATPPYERSNPNDSQHWYAGAGQRESGGDYGGPGQRTGLETHGARRDAPPPQNWQGGQSPPNMGESHGDGRTSWQPPSSQGPDGRGYGASSDWENERYPGQERPGMGGRGQNGGREGYYGRDDGYYQGPRGRDQWAPRRNTMDEYGSFPVGSRALVRYSGRAPSSMSEVRDQGVELVKRGWARILVSTGKTRAALKDAKERAADAAVGAGYKIKSTVGTVTSRVADALEGDPNGIAGPYGQPHDYYEGSGGQGDGRGPDQRSWQGPGPGGYGGNPQSDPRGPGAPGAGAGGGGGRYPEHQRSGSAPGGGDYGAGDGGFGVRDMNRASHPGLYPGAQGAGGGGYNVGGYGRQPGQASQGDFPQGAAGGNLGAREMGGGAYGPPGGRAAGGDYPYPNQVQQQQQQQQQPRPQVQGQGGPAGGGADGGYWVQCY